jgi:hypothetical protein
MKSAMLYIALTLLVAVATAQSPTGESSDTNAINICTVCDWDDVSAECKPSPAYAEFSKNFFNTYKPDSNYVIGSDAGETSSSSTRRLKAAYELTDEQRRLGECDWNSNPWNILQNALRRIGDCVYEDSCPDQSDGSSQCIKRNNKCVPNWDNQNHDLQALVNERRERFNKAIDDCGARADSETCAQLPGCLFFNQTRYWYRDGARFTRCIPSALKLYTSLEMGKGTYYDNPSNMFSHAFSLYQQYCSNEYWDRPCTPETTYGVCSKDASGSCYLSKEVISAITHVKPSSWNAEDLKSIQDTVTSVVQCWHSGSNETACEAMPNCEFQNNYCHWKRGSRRSIERLLAKNFGARAEQLEAIDFKAALDQCTDNGWYYRRLSADQKVETPQRTKSSFGDMLVKKYNEAHEQLQAVHKDTDGSRFLSSAEESCKEHLPAIKSYMDKIVARSQGDTKCLAGFMAISEIGEICRNIQDKSTCDGQTSGLCQFGMFCSIHPAIEEAFSGGSSYYKDLMEVITSMNMCSHLDNGRSWSTEEERKQQEAEAKQKCDAVSMCKWKTQSDWSYCTGNWNNLAISDRFKQIGLKTDVCDSDQTKETECKLSEACYWRGRRDWDQEGKEFTRYECSTNQVWILKNLQPLMEPASGAFVPKVLDMCSQPDKVKCENVGVCDWDEDLKCKPSDQLFMAMLYGLPVDPMLQCGVIKDAGVCAANPMCTYGCEHSGENERPRCSLGGFSNDLFMYGMTCFNVDATGAQGNAGYQGPTSFADAIDRATTHCSSETQASCASMKCEEMFPSGLTANMGSKLAGLALLSLFSVLQGFRLF